MEKIRKLFQWNKNVLGNIEVDDKNDAMAKRELQL